MSDQFGCADAHDMLGQVADLPQQLIDGWAAAEAIDLPLSFREVDRVVLAGMGGLAGGGALCASLVAPECQLPISVVRDYELPAYAHGAHTLVIATSYSGDTEETLAAFDQAQVRGCQSFVLASDGQLLEHARKQAVPVMRVDYQSRDFYPGVGDFTTEVYDVPITLGTETIVLRVGNLPDLLQMTLILAARGIIGTALLQTHRIVYAPRRKKLALQRISG